MKYGQIQERTQIEIESIIEKDDPTELLYVPLSVSLYSHDWHYAQEICINLSNHPDFSVRGNALLGIGHIARIHGKLERSKIEKIIFDGLKDVSGYVQSHAQTAFEDINHYLGWDLKSEMASDP